MSELRVVEICAGAGGQSLGLHLADFEHSLAVEIDETAAQTLRTNGKRLGWDMAVAVGDVAAVPEPGEEFDELRHVWNPDDYIGIDLLAGGVPCPPFSIAGKQLGTSDERDLFAWAVELVGRMRPRAVMLENVRGLSMPRFAAYRQWVKDRLKDHGYWSDWKLLEARDYGVPQLRPRFILVALHDEEDARHFNWPEPTPYVGGVGDALYDLMDVHKWGGTDEWRKKANEGIAPTIVGGSKKHGGADLGPTRAKRAWAELGVDAMGIANDAPNPEDHTPDHTPKLTIGMVKVLQGWLDDGDYAWNFEGKKTSQYRQIGNAFPPPVARAVGASIHAALERDGSPKDLAETEADAMQHEPIYVALKNADGPRTAKELIKAAGGNIHPSDFEQRVGLLSRDFYIKTDGEGDGRTYILGAFKGFVGQGDHDRHLAFATARNRIS